MLLAVVVSVLGASVEVAVDAPCVEAAFSGRLANAGVVLPPDSTLSLRRARGDVLEVTLKPKGAAPMHREVPAAARDCAGVERVVVALVKAWLASPVMVAGAGRDGGAPVDGGGSPSEAGSRVDARGVVTAGVDGGLSTAARGDVAGAATAVRSAVDGGPVTPARGDVGDAATAVRSGVDGGLSTAVRGDVAGSATPVPPALDGGRVTTKVGSATSTSLGARSDGGANTAPFAAVGSRAEVERELGDGGLDTAARAGVGSRAVIKGGPLGPALGEIERAMGWRADGGVGNRADVADGATTDGASGSAAEFDGGVQPSDAGMTRASPTTKPDDLSALADAGADPSPWSFGVGLLGGIASGTTTDVVPQGLLSVDVTRRWFGVALDVGLSGNVSRQVPPGAVTSSWQWLSLSARAVWEPLRRVSLDAQLGVRAHRIVALATGYAETKPEQQLLSVGAVGSVGASVRIVGPVGLTVRATGVVKPPERFTIDNLGAVLDLGTLEGGVHAGVVVRW